MLKGHCRVTDWPNFNIVMSQGIGRLEEGGVSKRGGETDEGVDREEGRGISMLLRGLLTRPSTGVTEKISRSTVTKNTSTRPCYYWGLRPGSVVGCGL